MPWLQRSEWPETNLWVKVLTGRVHAPAGGVGIQVVRAKEPGVSRGSHVAIGRHSRPLVTAPRPDQERKDEEACAGLSIPETLCQTLL